MIDSRLFAPYRLQTTDGGFTLQRDRRRGDMPRLIAQRVIIAALVGLTIALAFGASRLDGIDIAIAGLFSATCLAGALGLAWWMADGVHRVDVDAGQVTVARVGPAGVVLTRTVSRTAISAMHAAPIGAGPTARWRIEAETGAGQVEVACLARSGDDRAGPQKLADDLGVPLR